MPPNAQAKTAKGLASDLAGQLNDIDLAIDDASALVQQGRECSSVLPALRRLRKQALDKQSQTALGAKNERNTKTTGGDMDADCP